MKKINLIPVYLFLLLVAFSSCNSENDVMDANLKTETETVKSDYSETAFGYHDNAENSKCFDQAGFNRWGWTTGPFFERQILTLYAGAGQCDLTKGEKVGRVSLRYNHITREGRAYFETYAPYVMQETHLYVGSEMYPVDNKGNITVAPGKYPFKHSDLGGVDYDIHYFKDLPDNGNGLYMIAHAVVTK